MRLGCNEQQNSWRRYAGAHLFVGCVDRRRISHAGNKWSEQLSVVPESVHRIMDETGFDCDDERGLAMLL